MNSLQNLREVMRRDRVFDFMLQTTGLEVDLSHGTILYLEDVSVSFDGFKAINDLNLYIDAGELRCIIGPNGAGKTTMMDIITGKTRPDRGEVYFDGEIDLTHPTRNAHVRLRLLSEPGRRYLIEFEASGAGAGRFQVIDTLASTERKFASGDPHIAFVHEHPGDAPAWTSLILVSAHARWMFRRAMVTTLN